MAYAVGTDPIGADAAVVSSWPGVTLSGFSPVGAPRQVVGGSVGLGVAGGGSDLIEALNGGGERIDLRFAHRQCRVQITLGRLGSTEAAQDRIRIEALDGDRVVASTTVTHRHGDHTFKAVSLGGSTPFRTVRVTALEDLDGFWLSKVIFGRPVSADPSASATTSGR